MSHKTAATVALTIGIDTGKNTLHLIGLDETGAIPPLFLRSLVSVKAADEQWRRGEGNVVVNLRERT